MSDMTTPDELPNPDELAARFSILQAGHEMLRQTAQPIAGFDDGVWANLAEAMLKRAVTERAWGLSAPQVGVSARLIVCRVQGRSIAMANPEIYARKSEQRRIEGCLSVQHSQFRAEVVRSRFIKVRYQDVATGEWLTFNAKSGLAACIQHEIDHIDGILFTDRVKPVAIRKVTHGETEIQEGSGGDREVPGPRREGEESLPDGGGVAQGS